MPVAEVRVLCLSILFYIMLFDVNVSFDALRGDDNSALPARHFLSTDIEFGKFLSNYPTIFFRVFLR